MLQYIQIFGREIPIYGICALVGILAFYALARLRTKAFGVNPEDVFHVTLYAVCGAIIGAKVLYWITILPWIIQNFNAILSNRDLAMVLLTQGLVFYGGLIGGFLLCLWYLRRYKLDVLLYADAMVPGIGLFHALGRLGCFLSGCCYGVAWEHGICYPESHITGGTPLFPVQLVEAAGDLILCLVLCQLSRRWKGTGLTMPAYGIGYGVLRFVLEFFRGDAVRGHWGNLSTSQWISLAIIAASAVFIGWRRKKRKTAEPERQISP